MADESEKSNNNEKVLKVIPGDPGLLYSNDLGDDDLATGTYAGQTHTGQPTEYEDVDFGYSTTNRNEISGYSNALIGGTNGYTDVGHANPAFERDPEPEGSNPAGDAIYVDVIDDDGTTTSSPVPYLEGVPLKAHLINKQVKKIYSNYMRQLFFSIVRNILCWAFLVSIIVLLANASSIKDWHNDKIAGLSVVIAFGLVGVLFHVLRAYNDLTFTRPTVITSLLREAVTRQEFIRLMQNRQLSAPEIFFEVSLKSGAMSDQSPEHWTRTGNRSIKKEISYRGWADQSASVQQLKWPELDQGMDVSSSDAKRKPVEGEGHAAWMVVAKDFRCLDNSTFNSFQDEVKAFKESTGFNKNPYYMDAQFDLQWKESAPCPDAQPFLVLESRQYQGFYIYDIYRLLWFLALDSVYRIAFHFKTKKLEAYHIIKFIER